MTSAPRIHPLAGQTAPASALTDIPALIKAYFSERPDPENVAQRVVFGTSGHRGSALDRTFNEWHVLAISQAIADYRRQQGIGGPLFLGADTHALSAPATSSAIEVLAANGVELRLSANDEYTPTPAVSHAILTYNRERDPAQLSGLADGIVVTPSHNPPRDGGFKYNPTHGGPAEGEITSWIENKANEYLKAGLAGVKRMGLEAATRASTTRRHDYLSAYVADLDQVIDMDAIRGAKVRLGVDPMGGAGVHYWGAIADRYGIDLSVVSDVVDPTFSFMTLDWDGQIRMDPSSPCAMQRLLAMKDSFDVAFGCDTDHDRHGIVTAGAGLLPPNHYLCIAIDYLLQHRPAWSADLAIGKTVVSSQLIDRVARLRGRPLFEVPVGFKWFAKGLAQGTLAFGGEESAGASFLRRDGSAWTTDKDGITLALLSAEIAAVTGRDLGDLYKNLTDQLGKPDARRVDAKATTAQKKRLSSMSAADFPAQTLAGEAVTSIMTKAPANEASIGGLKVSTENAWFAARPSGTEDIYKLYAESYLGQAHLQQVLEEGQRLVDGVIAER